MIHTKVTVVKLLSVPYYSLGTEKLYTSREEKENDKGGKFVHRRPHLVYSLDSASNKYRIPPPRNYILRQLRNSIHVFENAESNFNSRDLMNKFYLSPISHFKDCVLRHNPQ